MKKQSLHADFSKKGAFGTVLRTAGKWWDENNPGFGMRVSPKLHQTWMYKGKSKGTGKQYEGSLPYHVNGDGVTKFTYDQALLAWGRIKQDLDLTDSERSALALAAQRKKRQRVTLDEAFEDFIENRIVKGAKTPLQPATRKTHIDRYNRYLKNVQYLGRRIGSYVLAETTARDWKEVIEAIAVSNILRKTSSMDDKSVVLTATATLPTGVPLVDAHAKQVLNLLSAVYDYLEGLEEVEKNPIRLVRKTTVLRGPGPRKTRIRHLDMKGFYANLKKRTKVKQAADATKVKFFTGFRNAAIRRMRWDRIDLIRGTYTVQRGDTGWKGFEGWMPLSDLVISLLRDIKSGARGYRHDVWVFPSRDRSTHLQSFRGTVELCGEGLSYRPIPHDLRKTFAGACHMVLRGDVILVGALLAHRWGADESGNTLPLQAVTSDYILPEIEVLRAAVNRVVDVILQICGEKPATTKTLALLKRNGFQSGHLLVADIPGDDDSEEEEEELLAA